MTKLPYDFFKMMHGKTIDEVGREIPSAESWVDRTIEELTSNFELRLLGTTDTEPVYISEEERYVNFHVVGAPGEGKSKFLEYQIREDIKKGTGLCLMDSSDFGATQADVLRYCASIGYEKVCIIDPYTLGTHEKLATLHPLSSKYVKQSVEGMLELTGILFGAKETDTPRIRRYLSAVLRLFARENLTLYETQYLANYQDRKDYPFLGFDRDSITIKNAFRSQYTWEQYFGSTINRLDAFWDEPLSLMLGSDTGINFVQMLREGWVILCNLAPGRGLNSTESRLLGVMIINQIIQAVDILKRKGWHGRYYFYIDEAGRFATPQLDDLLSQRRKSGLSLVIAHQFIDQFENKRLLNAVKQNTGVKVMFNMREPGDRTEMMRSLGYGGDITPNMASFANQDLPKQYAILKKNKEAPVRIRIPDVTPVALSNKAVEDYVNKLLEQPWYLTREQIKKQINARKLRAYTPRPKRREASDSQANNRDSVPSRTRPGKSIPKGDKSPGSLKKPTPFKF